MLVGEDNVRLYGRPIDGTPLPPRETAVRTLRPMPDLSSFDKIHAQMRRKEVSTEQAQPEQATAQTFISTTLDESNAEKSLGALSLRPNETVGGAVTSIKSTDSSQSAHPGGTHSPHVTVVRSSAQSALKGVTGITIASILTALSAASLLISTQTAISTNAAISNIAAKNRLQKINPNVIFGQSNGGGLIAE